MPGIALWTLIDPKVADTAHADKRVPLGLCPLLVKANLPAAAQWSAEAPIGVEYFYWIPLHQFALVAPTPAVAIPALGRL